MKKADKKRVRAKHLAKGRGRPPGQVPFSKNKSRFEIVWALVLMQLGKLPVTQAAELTTVLLHSRMPLQLTMLREGGCKISGEYPSLRKRAENLWRPLAKALPKLLVDTRENRRENGWFIHSVTYLNLALTAIIQGRSPGGFLDRLRELGWSEALEPFYRRALYAEMIPEGTARAS